MSRVQIPSPAFSLPGHLASIGAKPRRNRELRRACLRLAKLVADGLGSGGATKCPPRQTKRSHQRSHLSHRFLAHLDCERDAISDCNPGPVDGVVTGALVRTSNTFACTCTGSRRHAIPVPMRIPIGACSNRRMDHTQLCMASHEYRFILSRCTCGCAPETRSVLGCDLETASRRPAHEAVHSIFRLLVRSIVVKLLIWSVCLVVALIPRTHPWDIALAICVFLGTLWWMTSFTPNVNGSVSIPNGPRLHEPSGPGSMWRSPRGFMPHLGAIISDDRRWYESDRANGGFAEPPHTLFDRSCHVHTPSDHV
jgi:hypothetical protein